MTLKLLRLLSLSLLAGWQLSWAEPAFDTAQKPAPPPAQAAPSPDALLEAMQSAPPRGLFYQVSKGGKTAYLFGTIHVGKPEFFPLDMATTQALMRSSELAVELDATQTGPMLAALQRYATLPEPQSLDALLPSALGKRLHMQLDALAIPRESIRNWKPWMATLTLTMAAYKQSGYGFEYASDLYLTALARGLNKPITELEGIDYQFQLFDSLSPGEQLVFLDETLRYMELGKMPSDIRSIIEAWLGSDAEALQQLALKSFQDSPRTGRWMKQKLFTERNLRMAKQIDQRLDAGHTPFVAVGTLHLVGADGLPALFRQRGYRVVNLYP